MFRLMKEFRFEAAHMLPQHNGKCQRLHGHSWKLRVVCEGESVQSIGPQVGMLVDYARISTIVKPLVEKKLDHYYLNESTGLVNPTSEELAVWVYNQLKDKMPELVEIQIDETCTSSCCYRP